MAKLCMEYEDDFKSSLKRMGFVSKMFSQTKVRRLRELNCALAKRTGHKITVKNLDDKKGKRNLAYFDTIFSAQEELPDLQSSFCLQRR